MTIASLGVGLYTPAWPAANFPNGVVTYTHILASAFSRLGITPQILPWQRGDEASGANVSDLEKTFESRPCWAHALSPVIYRLSRGLYAKHRLRWSLLAEVSRLAREHRIELIEMEESFGFAAAVVRRCRVPVVLRLHGPWFVNGAALGVARDREFERRVHEEGRAFRSANAVCAPSRDVLERTIAHYRFKPERAEVIPLPVAHVPDELRWRAGEGESGRILFVGRFDSHKGGDLMIDAFCDLHRSRPQVRLVFVGPDYGIVRAGGQKLGLREYIAASVEDRAARQAIEWLGPLAPAEVAAQRKRAAVVVVASRYENFPYTALEAMAAGCPLIVPDVGGFPEMLEHERSGLRFRVGDASELAAALRRLIDQPKLAALLGERARADCRERYDPDRVAMRMLDLYRSVLGLRERQEA